MLLLPAIGWAQPMTVDLNGGSRPNPDPTVLGLAAQKEAIGQLREIFEAKIKAIYDEISQQKATLDLTDSRIIKRLDDVPKERDQAIGTLKQFEEQRFNGVDQQFRERDERVNQIAVLNNVALQAALSAAKEAVAKQDQNVTKQLDQLYLNSSTVTKAQEVQINDLKTQLAAITARGSGQSDLYGWIIGGGGLIIAAVTIIVLLTRQQQHQPYAYYSQSNGYSQPQPQPQIYVAPSVVPTQPR